MKYTDKLRFYARELDQVKYRIMEEGCAFHLTVLESDGTHNNIGIGTGADMSLMVLIQIRDLYDLAAKSGITPEDFAESVKTSIIKYIKAHPHAEQAHTIRFDEGDGCS